VIETPLQKLCRLTIPAAEKEKWHRGFMMVNPTFGYIFFLISADILDVNNWVQQASFIGSVVLGTFIRFCS
jgi:hypothetical protein